ncbi:MAG: hypothetical protein U1A27_06810 [Phycisphaerae bacterium]
MAVGCNPIGTLYGSTNYTINLPLGLSGGAGLLNPLQLITLLFANITSFLGLGYGGSGIITLPGGGGS